MEIQSDESQLSKRNSQIYKSLLLQLQKQPFSLKKASKYALKYENQFDLFQSLMNVCRSNKKIDLRLKICNVLVEILKESQVSRAFNLQIFRQMINEIYQIRREVDMPKMIELHRREQVLNSLIKLVKQLMQKLKKSKDSSLILAINESVYQNEKLKPFQSLNNIIFSLKILHLLDHTDENQGIQQQSQIADFYISKLLDYTPQSIEIQQIAAISILNCLTKHQNLSFRIDQFIKKSTFYQKLVILQKSLPEEFCLQLLKLKLCVNQQQLQLITLIVSNKYHEFPHLKRQLCTFWLINCCNLLQTGGSVELGDYISTLGPQISSSMLSFSNNKLNQSKKSQFYRQHLLYIWSALLKDLKVKDYLVKEQSLFISTELIFYRFMRQIVGQLSNTITLAETDIILNTFRLYYPLLLQHKQCETLRAKIINFYVQYSPSYLTPYFIIKASEYYKEYSTQITNLAIFNPSILQMLLQKVKLGQQTLIQLLGCLDNEVGVVLVKYIVQKNEWEYNDLFSIQKIVDYLVENNIQLHLDKFQYQLYKKINQNLQKFIKIIRKSTHKNRYQTFINSYILDLLENQLTNQSGLKKLPPSFHIFIYIVQRFCDIFSIAEQKGMNTDTFICSLYGLANRNLFVNCPDAIYLLLLSIAQLKQKFPGTVYNIEDLILENLSKFIKQYENHGMYYMLGFASIMIILYGIPSQQVQNLQPSYLQTITSTRLDQGLSKITWFLKSNDNLKKILNRKYQEMSQKIQAQLKKSIIKTIIYNTLKRINILALQPSFQQNKQISSLENVVAGLFDLQIPKPNDQIGMETEQKDIQRKRVNSTDHYEQETFGKKDILKKITIPGQFQHRQPNSLELLLNRLECYDQFKHFRYVESLIRSNCSQGSNPPSLESNYLLLERVDGKVRTILHVKK